MLYDCMKPTIVSYMAYTVMQIEYNYNTTILSCNNDIILKKVRIVYYYRNR